MASRSPRGLDRIDNLQEMVDAPGNFRRKYCEESRLLADVIGDADPELKAELLIVLAVAPQP